MKKRIINLITEILLENREKIDFQITELSNLRDIGLTSFDLAQLTVEIEDEFDIDIFEDGLVNTVGEIVSILEQNA